MNSSFKAWKKKLPHSKIIPPDDLSGKIKYLFWRLYTPLHPHVRDGLVNFGLVRHYGRQNFLIGRVAPGWTVESVTEYLIKKGYGNHFIAWIDDGEVVGLRYVTHFSTQYHIRIFHDGEIRGHREYTPECYPILHLREVGMEPCNDHFREVLGDCLVPAN